MIIEQIIPVLDAKILCGEQLLRREVHGGFACDMLSWVISRLQDNQAWFTILNSVNVVAVAVLSECSCVVLTEDVVMEADVLQRAVEKNLVVLSTPLPTYEACAVISALLKDENNASLL